MTSEAPERMPERVRLDPGYKGYQQQVIGWATDIEDPNDYTDWPQYIHVDLYNAMKAKAQSSALDALAASGQAQEAYEAQKRAETKTAEKHETIRAHQQVLAEVKAERDALRVALNRLCCDVDGMRAFEEEIRDVIGNTNWNCIRHFHDQGRAALDQTGGE